MQQASNDSPGVRFPPPLLYLIALGLGFLTGYRWPVHIIPWEKAWAVHLFGVLLILVWAVITPMAFVAFRRARTHINPTKPTTAIVRNGPYRYSRNPLYLGLVSLSAGISIYANDLWPLLYLAVAVLLIQELVIKKEEAYLGSKFGAEYESYKSKVRRWF